MSILLTDRELPSSPAQMGAFPVQGHTFRLKKPDSHAEAV